LDIEEIAEGQTEASTLQEDVEADEDAERVEV
jgi:hypothetical protein